MNEIIEKQALEIERLQEEVAHTVAHESEVEDEIRHLRVILSE